MFCPARTNELMLDHQVFGKLDGQTVIFVAGWPDTYSVFRNNLMAQLEREYRIIGITLPGFEQPASRAFEQQAVSADVHSRERAGQITTTRMVPTPALGYPHQTVVEMLRRTIYHVMEDSQQPHTVRPVLVCHDWGCYFGYELSISEHGFFERIVMIDVGGSVTHGETLSHKIKRTLFYLSYQMLIIFVSYLLPARLSQSWLRRMVTTGKRPEYTDCASGKVVLPSWRMAWPYLRLYFEAFTGQRVATTRWCFPITTPLLFIYSPTAPVPFHGPDWIRAIEARGAEDGVSKAVSVLGGHWFFARPDVKFNASRKIITDFIRQKLPQ